MVKKHIISDNAVETIGIYKITSINEGRSIVFWNEDRSAMGQLRISAEKHRLLFGDNPNSIYVVGYVDDHGVLQIFPDVEVEDLYW